MVLCIIGRKKQIYLGAKKEESFCFRLTVLDKKGPAMEINEENFKLLAQYLQQTLSPDPNVRRPGKLKKELKRSKLWVTYCVFFSFCVAEKFLESVEANQNYAILLLNLVDKEDIDATIRVAGSIAFKNFVKRNWNAHAVSSLQKKRIFSFYFTIWTNADLWLES